MSTLIVGSPPPELEALLERRRLAGADRHDEVWEGVLYMNPPPSHEHERLSSVLHRLLGPCADAADLEITGGIALGDQHDYRAPDLALHRPGAAAQWHPTAALVTEILSPGDETWTKLSFYAEHYVDEVLILDLAKRTITWLALTEGEYHHVERSDLIGLGSTALAEQLDWP